MHVNYDSAADLAEALRRAAAAHAGREPARERQRSEES
jgi:hypothetical protein